MYRGFIETRFLIVIFILFLIGIGIFAATRSKSIVIGPELRITEEVLYADIDNGFVTIEGTVKRSVYFAINGRIVTPEQNGNFRERLFAPAGHTIMQVTARDRFGRVATHNLFIYAPHHGTKEIYQEDQDSSEEESDTGTESAGVS